MLPQLAQHFRPLAVEARLLGEIISCTLRISQAGIVYCHRLSRTIGEIVRGLLLVAACLDADESRNHVEFL